MGADLFGIYEEAEAKKSAPATASPAITRLERTSSLISPEAVPGHSESIPSCHLLPHRKTHVGKCSPFLANFQVLKELSMWELERRTNLFKSNWKAPYFPHDGVGKMPGVHQSCMGPGRSRKGVPLKTCWGMLSPRMKWVSFEDNSYSRHPFIPEGVDEQKISAAQIECHGSSCYRAHAQFMRT